MGELMQSVLIDEMPTAGYIWDIDVTERFFIDHVSDRTLGNPLSFKLTAGAHHVSFINRESGVWLDSFEFVLVENRFDPPSPKKCHISSQNGSWSLMKESSSEQQQEGCLASIKGGSRFMASYAGAK